MIAPMDAIRQRFPAPPVVRQAPPVHAPALALPASPPADGRGLALIQIDGLSYNALQKAVAGGHMPNLRRLLDIDKHVARPFMAGIPCTTPASLCGFVHGHNDLIPGYEWYDKKTGQMYNASDYQGFEQAFEGPARAHGGPGLMTKGTVASSLVSGDSTDSHLVVDTMSQIYAQGGKTAVDKYEKNELKAYFKKHPFKAIRTAAAAVKEAIKYTIDDAIDETGIRNKWADFKQGVHDRIEENVVLVDLATATLRDAMKANQPVMFADLAGYDKISHQQGPYSRPAMSALHRIDKHIGELIKESRRPGHRQYELVFISDHGQTNGMEWSRKYGQTFEQWVNGVAHDKVVTADSGNLNHLYFAHDQRQLQLSEVNHRSPDVASQLLFHEGIDLVAARQNGTTLIMGKKGAIMVEAPPQQGPLTYRIYGDNPLEGRGDTNVLVSQMVHVVSMPNAGDLIVFGAQDGDKVITFSDTDCLGGHGGLGGDQNTAMIITEPNRAVNTAQVRNTEQLYPILRSFLPADGQP
jgi:hypothetical protein